MVIPIRSTKIHAPLLRDRILQQRPSGVAPWPETRKRAPTAQARPIAADLSAAVAGWSSRSFKPVRAFL